MEGVKGKCRLCVKAIHEDAKDIFKEKYAKQINEMFCIELVDTLNWPSRACSECIDFLEEMESYRETITASHKILYGEIYESLYKGPKAAATGREDSADKKKTNAEWKTEQEPEREVTNSEESDSRAKKIMESNEDPEASSSSELASIASAPMDPDSPIAWDELIVYDSDVDLDTFDLAAEGQNSSADDEPEQRKRKGRTEKKPRDPKSEPSPSLLYTIEFLKGRQLTEEQIELERVMAEMNFFKCHECEELTDYENLPSLKDHVKEKHNYQDYKICCDLRLKETQKGLYDHIRLHLNPDAFSCSECGKKFQNGPSLKYHRDRAHTNKNSFICHICGKGFNKECRLSEHITIKHTPKETCKYCQKEYPRGYGLKHHIDLMHEIQNNFMCGICGRGFTRRGALSSHILDHGGPQGGNRKKKRKTPTVAHPF